MALLTLNPRGSVILQHEIAFNGSVMLQHEMRFNGPAHSQLKGSAILQHEMAFNQWPFSFSAQGVL